MKKIPVSLFLLSVLVACSDRMDEPVINLTDLTESHSDIRSAADATYIAEKYLSELYGHGTQHSRNKDKFDVSVVTYSQSPTRSATEAKDTLMYILNFPDQGGYALVPASKEEDEIIAITERGSLNSVNDNDNPGLQMFLDNTLSRLSQQRVIVKPEVPDTGKYQFAKYFETTDTLVYIVRSPRLVVNWAQNGWEGAEMNNGLAGCSNLATAMIFSYLERPTSIKLSYNDNSILPLDWQAIKMHKTAHSVSNTNCPATLAAHQQLSKLIKEISYRNKSKLEYNPSETKTNYDKAISTIKDLLPEYNVLKRDNFNNIVTDLATGIFYMRGERAGGGGHAWVVDGCNWLKTIITKHIQYINDPYPTLIGSEYYERPLVHINWGWGGSSNGYFNYKILNPNEPFRYDDPFALANPAITDKGYVNEIKYTVIYN